MFDNTRKALVEFDATRIARQKAWHEVETNSDVFKAELDDHAALAKVQEAFHQDTKEFNSRESCSRVDIQFMWEMAEGKI